MLHGKVLRSELAHARIARIDTSAAEAMPGVVVRADRRRPERHRPLLRPRDQGPADPRDRPRPLRRRAGRRGRRRDRGDRRGRASRRSRSSTRSCPSSARSRRRSPTTPRGSTRSRCAPGSSTASALLEERGRQRLLPLPARLRQRRGRRRGGGDRGRGRVPSSRPSTSTRWRRTPSSATSARTPSRSGPPASTRSWSAPRSPICSACRSTRVRVIVPYLGGGFGSQVVHEDGADHGRPGAQGRPAGADPEQRRRVDGHDAPPRHAGLDAHRGDAPTAAARRARSASTSTPAPTPTTARASCATGGDAAPGPYRWQAVRVRRQLRLHQHRRPSGSYRAFGASHLQWIGESQVDEVARRAGLDPLEMRRRNLLTTRRARAAHRRQAARRRPRRRRREGGRRDRLGRAARRRASAAGCPSACSPPGAHPVSRAVVRLAPDGAVEVNVGTTEVGQGARTVIAQIAAEELAHRHGSRPRAGRRHRTSRRTTARPAPAARRRSPASPSSARPPTSARQLLETAGPALGAEPEDLEVRDGAVSDGERELDYPSLIETHFGFSAASSSAPARCGPSTAPARTPRARSSGRSASPPPRSRSTARPARCSVRKAATVADVGKAINPQLVERQDEGGAMQGLGNALFEEMIFTDGDAR